MKYSQSNPQLASMFPHIHQFTYKMAAHHHCHFLSRDQYVIQTANCDAHGDLYE